MQLDFKLANSPVLPKLDGDWLLALVVAAIAGHRLYLCHTSPDSLGGPSNKRDVPVCRKFCN